MKRGRLAQYGLTRTTYTGNVEREDAQPNESLHNNRTPGPPTVRVTPTPAPAGNWIPIRGHKRGRGESHKPDSRAVEYSRDMAQNNANTSATFSTNRGRKWGNNFLEPAVFPPRFANSQPSGSSRQRQDWKDQHSHFPGSQHPPYKRQKQIHEAEVPDSLPPVSLPTAPQRPVIPPLPFRPRKNFTPHSQPIPPSHPPSVSLPRRLIPNSNSPTPSNETDHTKSVIPPLPSRPHFRKPAKPAVPAPQSFSNHNVKSEPVDLNLSSIPQLSQHPSSHDTVKREPDEPTLQVPTAAPPAPKPISSVKSEPPETSPISTSLSTLTPLPTPEVTPGVEPGLTVNVKPEPDEPIVPERRLVTSAFKRFPLPDDCSNEQPNYRERRHAFHKEKVLFLRSKGLTVGKKALFREDGMVLEWSSEVPVWDDTFESEAPLPSTPRKSMTPTTRATVDLATALNAAARENAEISVRSLKRRRAENKLGGQYSHSPSPACFSQPMPTSSMPDIDPTPSAPLPTSTLTTAITPAIAAEPGPPELVEEQEELEERPQKIIRPSQVLPPNPHPPKRTFKPVHPPPRPVKHADTHESGTTRHASSSTPPASFKKPTPTAEATVPTITSQTSHTRVQGLNERRPATVPVTRNTEASNRVQRAASCDVVESYLVSPSGVHLKLPGFEPQPQPPTTRDTNLQQHTPAHGPDVDDPMGTDAISLKELRESEDEEESGVDIMELAEEFLCRFLKMFDTNRIQLRSAYSPDATFNVRVHRAPAGEGRAPCLADPFCQDLADGRSPVIYQDRDRIVERLCALGPHRFFPEAGQGHVQAEPVFDLVARSIPSLPLCGGIGSGGEDGKKGDNELEVFVVAFHGEAVHKYEVAAAAELSEVAREHVVSVDQSFVLRMPDAHGYDNSDLWPLTIMSHQMVVRDGPMLRQDRVEELVPWIREAGFAGRI